MKIIPCKLIAEKVRALILEKGVSIDGECLKIMERALDYETGAARFALDVMLKNAALANESLSPVCQDTGMVVAFIQMGQEVRVSGGFIGDAVNTGVRQAYADGYFRKSVLDPITRQNTSDNTPAVIHYEIVPGEDLKIQILLKGFGSENMSRLFMLSPSDGIDGVENAVLQTVIDAGGNPCPPIMLGVGVGGTMEKAALMSKHALLRPVSEINPDKFLAEMEKRLLEKINATGIGAQGFGGKLTCMGVSIEKFPTHLAGLPVAVTVQCHSVRHGEINF